MGKVGVKYQSILRNLLIRYEYMQENEYLRTYFLKLEKNLVFFLKDVFLNGILLNISIFGIYISSKRIIQNFRFIDLFFNIVSLGIFAYTFRGTYKFLRGEYKK